MALTIENVTYAIGDPSPVNNIWVPIVQGKALGDQEGQYFWLDDRNGKKRSVIEIMNWRTSQPNGENLQRCVELKKTLDGKDSFNDNVCSRQRYSICKVPIVQKYLLRGMHDFDHEYTLSLTWQESQDKMIFDGREKSKIVWYPAKGKTELTDQSNGNVSTKIDQNPFGRWRIRAPSSYAEAESWENSWIFTNVR